MRLAEQRMKRDGGWIEHLTLKEIRTLAWKGSTLAWKGSTNQRTALLALVIRYIEGG